MKSPFKFLDSYTKDDREIFFGREREIEELYHRVFESKIMLVYGVSGTGKSSLIHCGLANKFQETDWLPIVIRRGANIIDSMAAAIKAASITFSQDKTGLTVSKKDVLSLYLDYYKPVYFIFDQFEELFIFGDKEERRAFIHIVKSLIESDLQCRMIFVMREEYMAGITEFEKFIPTIFLNRVRIEKMSHRNALEAIKGPCKVFNINIEEGFSESLLEKLSPGSEDVELTYLQVFLDKIFRLASEEKKSDTNQLSFTISQLQKTGNVSDLLGSFLDDQISLMEDPDLAMTVLKAFVSGKGTKRPASESETIDNVRSLGKEISPEAVKELIRKFVNLRVLRDKDDNGRYELRHDALAEKVYEKFSTAEKELLEIRQMIENAYQYYLKRKILLNNDDLNYISNKDSLLNLNDELKAFLEESRKLQRAKIRTIRRLTVISAFAFIILLITLGYYVSNMLAQVNANYLAVNSINQISDPYSRLKMAGQAWKSNSGVLPREALLKAFNDLINYQDKDSVSRKITDEYKLKFDPAPVNIQYAECSKDNKYIFGYGDSLILIWDIKGKLEHIIRTNHYPVIDLKMSPDSWLIGAVSKDGILTVWNGTGQLQFSKEIQSNKLNTKQIFKFTKDNNVIALSKDDDAVLYGSEGNIIQTFNRHKNKVNAVDISSDNRFIATASSDSTVIIWHRENENGSYKFYNMLKDNQAVISSSFSSSNFGLITNSTNVFATSYGWKFFTGFESSVSSRFTYIYAEFSGSDYGFLVCSLDTTEGVAKKSWSSMNYNNPVRYQSIKGDNHYPDPEKFDYLAFSNDDNYFLYTRNGRSYLADNRYYLALKRSSLKYNYTLMSLEGTNPFFTCDSKYVISLIGNAIISNFIDIKTILAY